MILAIDIGGDRLSYGYNLIIESIRKKYGDIIQYVSNKDLHKININDYPIVLCGFMFIQNYIDYLPTLKKLKLEYDSENRDQIIIVGGAPISENPEPIAPYFDIGVIGEGEFVILDILEIIFRNNLNKDLSLQEIYSDIDCAYIPKYYKFEYDKQEKVKSYEGKTVNIRREDPNKSFSLYNLYSRNNVKNLNTEYQFEYHRGCKRHCKFCSYSYLQTPYREATKNKIISKIEQIIKKDQKASTKVIPIQTSLFHMDIDILRYLKTLDKLPNYSSACLADLWTEKGLEIFEFIQSNSQTYMRYGIEGFSEKDRKTVGKPIPNNMIINLPAVMDRGTKIKFFMIVGIPGQTIEDVQEFEETMNRLSKNLNYYLSIDLFKTALNFKLNTGLNHYPKLYNVDVIKYLETRMRRKYGKLQLKVFKPQTEDYFKEVNLLSLANRKMANVLLEMAKGSYNRNKFIELSEKEINVDSLFLPYDKNELLPNCFIDYRNGVKQNE